MIFAIDSLPFFLTFPTVPRVIFENVDVDLK